MSHVNNGGFECPRCHNFTVKTIPGELCPSCKVTMMKHPHERVMKKAVGAALGEIVKHAAQASVNEEQLKFHVKHLAETIKQLRKQRDELAMMLARVVGTIQEETKRPLGRPFGTGTSVLLAMTEAQHLLTVAALAVQKEREDNPDDPVVKCAEPQKPEAKPND